MVTHQRRRAIEQTAEAERMAALGTLAAGVAHEINNPLTYVLLQLTSVARHLPTLASAPGQTGVRELEALVAGALEGVQRIRAITTGIRKFSRMDDESRWHLDVRSPIEAALAILGTALDERARLVTQHEPAPYVLANEARLAQVFLALLTNAVQALPEGAPESNEIRITTCEDADGNAVVEITDSGIGIPEHLLPRIFEPFFTTRGVGEGTGLGLSISYGIVQAMGGELRVSSQPGHGTTVRVVLPRGQTRVQ
jgi:signal transduction histidine kinase